jgi:hypothetical protein
MHEILRIQDASDKQYCIVGFTYSEGNRNSPVSGSRRAGCGA